MIHFESVQQAEAALGRALTKGELLWFQYTANVPDLYLYCVNVALLFVVFSILPLPIVLLDWLKAERYKLQPGVHNSTSVVVHCYKSVVFLFFAVAGPLHIASYPFVKLVGIHSGLSLPSFWIIVLQLTVYFIVEDFGHYWAHRWLHSDWAFKNIHYLHHEIQAPMSFAATYVHWSEIIILGLLSFLGPALVPCHMFTFWLWISFRQLEALEAHTGYNYPWSPTKLIPFYGGSEYHDYHHLVGGNCHSNFASVFTYCDRVYGTDKHMEPNGYVGRTEYISFVGNGIRISIPKGAPTQGPSRSSIWAGILVCLFAIELGRIVHL